MIINQGSYMVTNLCPGTYSVTFNSNGTPVTLTFTITAGTVSTTGAQWVCDAFTKYVGLDISDYTIKEYINNENTFLIYIREEDLIKLREDKLNILID